MEDPKSKSFGKSILVPSVQELAKEEMQEIPRRYVRPDQDPVIVSAGASLLTIPVVDLEKLQHGDLTVSELGRLDSACQDWGFFQLINHGVSHALVEKMKSAIREFFSLPMEEKKKYWQQKGEVEGFGQAFVVSEEQKLDWGDLFFLTTLPPHLRKSHLYHKLPPFFRETMEAYAVQLEKLAKTLLGLMAQALHAEAKEISQLFDGGFQAMRMNYYPPCPQPEKVIGLTPHSDSVALTLLLQVNEVEGLQIRKDGNWIPVKPLPNAFVVNIGDIMEIISNGIYRSIEHRAVVNSTKERLSIATFYNPNFDSEIGPAPSLIKEQTPARFRRVGTEKYFQDLFTRELQGKSYLDSLRLNSGMVDTSVTQASNYKMDTKNLSY